MEGCPAPATIGAFVETGEPEGEVQRHVAGCAACREAVAELRANAAFVARFRAAGVLDASPTLAAPAPPPGAALPPPRLAGSSHESPDPDEPVHPDLLKGYRIIEEIHRGGQGVVYRAVHVQTQRTVAIKMLLAGRGATGRDQERFEREARMAAGLRHPNIVTVYDSVYAADGRLAFAMEYIEGEPLDRWSRSLDRARGRDGRRAALRRRLEVMVKVCDAVLCAHQHAIVHRDLKPANILVDAAGEPHVLDFGIARDTGPQERTRLTHPGGFAGTLAYASPEQVSGDPSRVDTRTDIYTLGVIMYEMVSGRMPYAVEGPIAQAIRNIEKIEPIPLPRATRDPAGPFVDSEVATIILKALAKEPARRYQTVAGLGGDIHRYLTGEAIEARRNSTWYVLKKAAARHRLALSGAVLVFLLLAAFGAAMAWQREKLAVALSDSTIERGRARVQLGNIPEAESLLWAQLLDAPAGVERWNPADSRLPLSRAWWALWELYAANPCVATVRTTKLDGLTGINVLLSVPGHDDLVLIAGAAGIIELRTLPDLSLRMKTSNAVDPELGRQTGILAGAFTPEGVLVTIGKDNTIRRWNANTLESLGTPFLLTSPAPDANDYFSLSANASRLAAIDGSVIRLIDAGSGSVLETFVHKPNTNARASLLSPDMIRPALLSPDGRWLAFGDQGGMTVHRVGVPEAANHPYLGPAFEWAYMAFAGSIDDAAPRLFFTVRGAVFVLGPDHPGQAHQFAALNKVSRLARIALSNDGRWLAIAGEDRRISLWDARGAAGILALPYRAAHDSPVAALAITPDDRLLLSGHPDGVVQCWDLSDLSSARRGAFMPLTGHEDSVFAVSVGSTAAGPRGYSGAYDRTVRAWDLESGREVASSGPLDGLVESIALSPDGRTIAAAIDMADHADVVFFDTQTLHSQARIEKVHEFRCADLAFSPDGASLATAGQDGFVRIWDISTRQEKAHYRLLHRGDSLKVNSAHTARFSPDGRTLGWGAADGGASLSDPLLAAAPRALSGNSHTVRCLRFSPDGRRVAATGNDSTVWMWDTATGRPVHEMKGHAGTTYAVAFSPDGRLLASGGSDCTVRLWDSTTGNNLAILRDNSVEHADDLAIFAVQFTPDGDHLLVGGNYGYLGVWDLRHFDRHIAGNLEYQLDLLKKSGRPSPMAGAARRWSESHKHAAVNRK